MGLRFWRTIRIAPGIRVNLSKRGASVSLGPRGAHLTVGTSGARYSVGLPGTGLSYGDKILRTGQKGAPPPPARRPGEGRTRKVVTTGAQDLDVSFLEALTLSGSEKALVHGLKALREDRPEEAASHLSGATGLADGLFMAGVAAMRLERWGDARRHLEGALARSGDLGSVLAKYAFDATIDLPIAPEYVEEVGPDAYGAALLLAEACQALGEPQAATEALRSVQKLLPESATVALSLAEIHLAGNDPEAALSALTDKEGPEPLQSALSVYRGRALRELGMAERSLQALVVTARDAKKMPGHLARALRYERALSLEALGRAADARSELEAIYADDPAYEDVAERLGRR